jgi:hypothetical protein
LHAFAPTGSPPRRRFAVWLDLSIFRAGPGSGRAEKKLFRAEKILSLFGWLVADGWCWFVLREKYCWLVVGGWFVLREKYCWLVADKPSEQVAYP